MKAKDLAKILLENPDFDVIVSFTDKKDGLVYGIYLRSLEITGVSAANELTKKTFLEFREITKK